MQSSIFNHLARLILIGMTKPSYVRALIDKHDNASSTVVKAQFDKYLPFVVSIAATDEGFENEYLHQCTGSLISDKLVLTAAHCCNNNDKTDLQVFVGSNDLRNVQTYVIESWIGYCMWYILKNYQDCDGKTNDIAIIQLTKPVENPPIKPAILSYEEKNVLFRKSNSQKMFTVGWGSTKLIQPTVELKIATLKLISDDECQDRLEKIGASTIVIPQFICSIGKPDWILLTDGDSGGPLMNENFAIVGINKAVVPNEYNRTLSKEIIRKHESNVHMSLYVYKEFVEEVKKIGVTEFFNAQKTDKYYGIQVVQV